LASEPVAGRLAGDKSTEEDLALSEPTAGARSRYGSFWSKAIESGRRQDFVTALLVFAVGLLASLDLALLIEIPDAESLLWMPL
jgi:hypothetical protein